MKEFSSVIVIKRFLEEPHRQPSGVIEGRPTTVSDLRSLPVQDREQLAEQAADIMGWQKAPSGKYLLPDKPLAASNSA